MTEDEELLHAFDSEVRTVSPDESAGSTVERDGPLFRRAGAGGNGNFVLYPHLGGLRGEELRALIARQVAFFAERGQEFEWKTYGHDAPPELPQLLLEAGFAAQEPETVVIGRAAPLAATPRPPEGVRLREVKERADLEKIDELNLAAFGEKFPGMVDYLVGEVETGTLVVLAEAGDQAVCSGWLRFGPGRFASLWGGGTRPEWRGKGVYKALVAHRAQAALARGYEFLQVDCTEDSRPILERLGMSSVTTTTPYIWKPPTE
ncbi:MAG: GNAT family N-acetyltransferase [Catenulispora sp.]|nr:GNAT family N-acetyltransferase [Catenulispora sp.]